MCADTVSDICVHLDDGMGDEILEVYDKTSNVYAVYGTRKRVKIQYADSVELMQEQRRALALLHPLRGQIDQMLDRWRASPWASARAKAAIFDRQTAYALTIALQGDQARAEALLKEVRNGIAEEQESIGRAVYLAIATVCAFGVFAVCLLISGYRASPPPVGTYEGYIAALSRSVLRTSTFMTLNKIPLAAGFGALGALFSIAIGIRKRAIQPDMQYRDNVIDALLRIMIGAVSAVILFSLLRSQLVALSFGARQVNFGTGDGTSMHLAIVVAFVAGFAEMLVGDYLTKAVVKEPAGTGVAAQAAAQRETEANEQNPRGRKEVEQWSPPAGGAGWPGGDAPEAPANMPGAPAAAAGHDHEAGLDGCVCGMTHAEDEFTGDEELPAATGGILGRPEARRAGGR